MSEPAHVAIPGAAAALDITYREKDGTRLCVIQPTGENSATDLRAATRVIANAELVGGGAVLYRGFAGEQLGSFSEYAAGFGRPLVTYEFGSTPRTRIRDGVYSSTDYPPHQRIAQHNEQSYTLKWPRWIWFHCELAPGEGGATPIADSREVYRHIDPAVRARFRERRILYTRNYGNGLDLPWEEVFRTTSRAAVEAFCTANHIDYEWLADGGLRTRQLCHSQIQHPVTKQWVWFNQAHLFHVSSLAPEVRAALLDAVDDESSLPRNACYGDGSPIETAVLDHIRSVYSECSLSFAWRRGDILMLDNVLMSHGREPFQGPRRILVAMAE